MGRPRTYDEALREQLILRASNMMSENGYHGVSLRVLTRDVGTSTNAVYTLFGSKEALMAEAMLRHLDSLISQEGMPPETDDPEQDLRSVAALYRDFAVGDPNSFNAAFEALKETRKSRSLTDRVNPELRDLDKKLFGHIHTVCKRIASANPDADLDPQRMAVAVWALIHGYSALEISGALPKESDDDKDVFDEAVHAMYLGWLAKDVEQLHEDFEDQGM